MKADWAKNNTATIMLIITPVFERGLLVILPDESTVVTLKNVTEERIPFQKFGLISFFVETNKTL